MRVRGRRCRTCDLGGFRRNCIRSECGHLDVGHDDHEVRERGLVYKLTSEESMMKDMVIWEQCRTCERAKVWSPDEQMVIWEQ